MRAWRRLAAVAGLGSGAVVLGLGGVVLGAAASLSIATDSFGASTVAAPRCTTAGLAVTPLLSGTTVASVNVAGLPSTCGGGLLQATVNNGAMTGSGSATIPAGGGSVTVTLATAPSVTADLEADLLITGP